MATARVVMAAMARQEVAPAVAAEGKALAEQEVGPAVVVPMGPSVQTAPGVNSRDR